MLSSDLERRPDSADATRSETPTKRRPELVLLVASGVAIYLAVFLVTVRKAFVRLPFGDAYDFLTVEFQAQEQHDPGWYLWTPHNGHHLVWIRLLTSLDVRLFHGQSKIFVVAALGAALTTAGLLSLAIWRNLADKRWAIVAAAIPPLALLTTINAIDVSVPVNIVYVLALVFAIPAFLVLEMSRGGLGAVIAILALITGAAMGNSIGLAAVPVVMIAAARRRDRGKLPLLWIAAPAVAALFVLHAGQMSVEVIPPAAGPIERALRSARYFVSFCGLPWSASSSKMSLPGGLQSAAQAAGALIGLVAAAAGAFLAARAPADDSPRSKLDRLCCDLILLSFAAAAMAALGRVDASTGMPVRYGLLMAPLHIGVIVLLMIRSPVSKRLGQRPLVAALAIVMAFGIAHQFAGQHLIVRYCAKLEEQLEAFKAGRRGPEMTEYVYPRLDHAERVDAEMKKRGVYQ